MEYGVYGALIIILYLKPYSIYLRGTIGAFRVKGLGRFGVDGVASLQGIIGARGKLPGFVKLAVSTLQTMGRLNSGSGPRMHVMKHLCYLY